MVDTALRSAGKAEISSSGEDHARHCAYPGQSGIRIAALRGRLLMANCVEKLDWRSEFLEHDSCASDGFDTLTFARSRT